MGITVENKSRCFICGEVLSSKEKIIGFTSFLPTTYWLHKFSDSAIHQVCFDNHSDKQEVNRLYAEFEKIWNSRPKTKDLKKIQEWQIKTSEEWINKLKC